MQWSDEAVVLGSRRHGETSAILEVLTRAHGRHLGLVRGGTGSRMRPVLQPGNVVGVVWRARLDEHLGQFTVEAVNLRAGSLLGAAHALYGVTHVAALSRLLPERDPHPDIFALLEVTLDHLHEPRMAAALVARFELRMLSELGFGLDMEACAATGATADLVYVSPKSGRAVSRGAGEAWRDRLLSYPAFLGDAAEAVPTSADLNAAFALTGFFLTRHVFEPRGTAMPDARGHFIAAIARALPDAA